MGLQHVNTGRIVVERVIIVNFDPRSKTRKPENGKDVSTVHGFK